MEEERRIVEERKMEGGVKDEGGETMREGEKDEGGEIMGEE